MIALPVRRIVQLLESNMSAAQDLLKGDAIWRCLTYPPAGRAGSNRPFWKQKRKTQAAIRSMLCVCPARLTSGGSLPMLAVCRRWRL